ncbi:MAG: MFS transporter, partial [Chloroflexales bacterium]|nr:MFS transporter [Chloroflexales bacterium]
MHLTRATSGPAAITALGISPTDHARRWWILAACCTVSFAQLAEPHLWILGLEIPASAFGVAWQEYRFVANLGLILFVAFQLIGGVMGDLLGRRRILLIGAIGSLACNALSLAAWSLPALIVCRALVGLFGALAFPLALGMIRLYFLGDERKIALLIYNFVIGVGTLAALLGIPLEDWFGWRWALALPIIAGAIGLQMAWRYLPESSAPGGVGRVEAVAAAAWTFITLVVMFGLVVARVSGTWLNPLTLAAAAAALAGTLVLVVWTGRMRRPGLFQAAREVPRHMLSLMLLVSATFSFALSGYVLQMYQFFLTVQQNWGLVAGLALAPILLGTIPLLPWAGRFAIEQPRHIVVGAGLGMMGAAMLMSTLLRPNFPYLLTIPIMTLFGVGFLVGSAAWAYFFFSVLPADLAGLSAGINRAAGMVGSALAGVLLSSIVELTGMLNFRLRLADLGLDDAQKDVALKA